MSLPRPPATGLPRARIRVHRWGFDLLKGLLAAEKQGVFCGRKHRPRGEDTASWNLRIAQITLVQEELDRLAIEQGWIDPPAKTKLGKESLDAS